MVRLEDDLTLYDLGFLARAGIRLDLDLETDRETEAAAEHADSLGPEDELPSDEEITEAIIREMDITHMPREEVLRTVREFFKRDSQERE